MPATRSHATELFGERVAGLRAEAGWSRVKLAGMAGIDPSYLARLEKGESTPTLHVIIQLAASLSVKPESFVVGLSKADLPPNIQPYSLEDFIAEKRHRHKD